MRVQLLIRWTLAPRNLSQGLIGGKPTDIEDMSFDKDGGDDCDREGVVIHGEFSRDFVLGFGKHKGKKLSEVPNSYLTWMQDKDTTLDTYLKGFANDELHCRQMEFDQEAEMEVNPKTVPKSDEDVDSTPSPTSQDKTPKKWPNGYSTADITRILINRYIPKIDGEAFRLWKHEKIGNRGFLNLSKEELVKFTENMVETFQLGKDHEA